MDFVMRIGLGKHVCVREKEVVQVPVVVELALNVIKRGTRALRISVQNPAHPMWCGYRIAKLVAMATDPCCVK